MQVNRKKTRRFLFQKLYSSCFYENESNKLIDTFFREMHTFIVDEGYLNEMLQKIIKYEGNILEVIQKYAPKFNIKNMNIVYMIPIYIGVCEMLYLEEKIPAKVSMNESIELAKLFGDESARKIVNGVLNKVYKDIDELKKNSSNPIKNGFSIFNK